MKCYIAEINMVSGLYDSFEELEEHLDALAGLFKPYNKSNVPPIPPILTQK